MLELQNIQGGYRKDVPILNGINLTVKVGDTLAVLGQNGCGKSTLAKAIVNQLPFLEGEIQFYGKQISGKNTLSIVKSGIGFFMQGGRTFPHLTIKENLRLAAHQITSKEFELRFAELKEYFSLLQNDKLGIESSYLSGGEKHLLALAMIIINKPKLLILDEPSAGLSPANVEIMYQTIATIKQTEKITVLLIEQNVEKAIMYSNRVALLSNGIIAKELDVHSVNTIEQINDFYFKLES